MVLRLPAPRGLSQDYKIVCSIVNIIPEVLLFIYWSDFNQILQPTAKSGFNASPVLQKRQVLWQQKSSNKCCLVYWLRCDVYFIFSTGLSL
jgi:hypothetical protein